MLSENVLNEITGNEQPLLHQLCFLVCFLNVLHFSVVAPHLKSPLMTYLTNCCHLNKTVHHLWSFCKKNTRSFCFWRTKDQVFVFLLCLVEMPTLFRTNRFQVTTSTVQYPITMPLTWSPKACFHPWTLSGLTNIPKADLSLHQIVFFHAVDMFQTLTIAECPLPCAQVDAFHTCSARPWPFLAVFTAIRPRLVRFALAV